MDYSWNGRLQRSDTTIVTDWTPICPVCDCEAQLRHSCLVYRTAK